MNQGSEDEFEEVESPFASKITDRAIPRPKLRNRKNVFNRPFSADSTQAPLLVETGSRRKTVGRPDEVEIINHRSSALSETEIDYLQDEEEEFELEEKKVTRSLSQSSKKTKSKNKLNLLSRLGWISIGMLVLRLISMDRGVWDYFSTEKTIQEKKQELLTIQKENSSLKNEIIRIKTDKNFQRQLAKEHLGVIAVDEFLVLFAGESNDSPVSSDSGI